MEDFRAVGIAEEIRKDPNNEKIVGVKINNVKEQDNDIR